ncbi:40S ribosomal protein S9 [Culex quinquefasciatus]|uniref:40S ribosomal protein S9 n=1 Tax=Culex quinquefasciatus TaxID=7176 RepID=B0WBG6_CULQU|nr:40S ribosomal protein S9 [Culex quinquefasciatus]EDS42408.1 40S ribosomal protein S9 [Culex quinquefasciatus]|eukprot:XP_001846050.1 40S ribosomal protein S9 [Culex quinquefasciatus]
MFRRNVLGQSEVGILPNRPLGLNYGKPPHFECLIYVMPRRPFVKPRRIETLKIITQYGLHHKLEEKALLRSTSKFWTESSMMFDYMLGLKIDDFLPAGTGQVQPSRPRSDLPEIRVRQQVVVVRLDSQKHIDFSSCPSAVPFKLVPYECCLLLSHSLWHSQNIDNDILLSRCLVIYDIVNGNSHLKKKIFNASTCFASE